MTHVLTSVAWPYANGPRHIGHVAGFGVPSDVFSRYMRMAGHDVLMVSGSDEHGTPILIAADEAGVTPQELADKNHRVIAEDLAADRVAEARLDDLERHLALAETGNLQAFLVFAQRLVELFVDARRLDLDL